MIHHNNRNGGFRGTSAIRAAVDETWNMQNGDKKLLELGLRPVNTRIVTVEKSRDDREGHQMVFSLMGDSPTKSRVRAESTVKFPTPKQLMKVMPADAEDGAGGPSTLVDDEVLGRTHKRRGLACAEALGEFQVDQRCASWKDAPKRKGDSSVYYRDW